MGALSQHDDDDKTSPWGHLRSGPMSGDEGGGGEGQMESMAVDAVDSVDGSSMARCDQTSNPSGIDHS